MDFDSVLHKAQRNERSPKKEPVRYYSTKFQPPKKEQRNKQKLSANIKKFLARKEEEEKRKQLEANRKKQELFALRSQDKKATRRVNVMLKRGKSANQSVIEDAVDRNNTSVTLAGPAQPDEDDYGYVSQEAAAYYNKMMEKYSKIPEEPKFSLEKKKKLSVNLTSTKDRVRAALEEEANTPHKRKRKHHEEVREQKQEEEPEPEVVVKKPKPKVAAPPPINFSELLKLAEKKQFEPVVIEQKPKEEERLLTKKQKQEMEIERARKERREGRIPTINRIQGSNNPKTNELRKKENVPLKQTASISKPTLVKPKIETGKVREELRKPISNNLPRKEFPPKDLPKQLPVKDVKPKPFPPPDIKQKQFPPKDVRRKPLVNKRRILDDDDEYDSELDDFIDDGPENGEDYSKYISEIFGYDKSRYRNVDDDIDNMESTFAQQMREEVISTKIGIMEDLEDMKQEEEEKRRKALMKKQKLK